jgi:acyl-CoA thioesterase-1
MSRSGRVLALTGLFLLGVYLAGLLPQTPDPPHDIALAPVSSRTSGLRIVAFGTSLTARSTWPQTVAAALSACTGSSVSVVKLARPGAGSRWAKSQIGELLALKPDLVVMEFAINDADLHDGLSPGNSRQATREIVQSLRGEMPNLPVLLLTTNPVAGLAKLQRPLLPLYYQSYAAVASDTNTGLVDGFARWLRRADWQAALPDGVHPFPEAEAELYAAPIAATIATAFGWSCSIGQLP